MVVQVATQGGIATGAGMVVKEAIKQTGEYLKTKTQAERDIEVAKIQAANQHTE